MGPPSICDGFMLVIVTNLSQQAIKIMVHSIPLSILDFPNDRITPCSFRQYFPLSSRTELRMTFPMTFLQAASIVSDYRVCTGPKLPAPVLGNDLR